MQSIQLEMVADVYTEAHSLARWNKQTVGEKNDFYITLEQLNNILKAVVEAKY